MNDAKVKHHPELVRRGGAIINTDNKEYERALARRQQATRINNLENAVMTMSETINSMARILQDLASRK